MIKQKVQIKKDIPGYEGYYQVDNFGNIYSLDRTEVGHKFSTEYTRNKKGRIIKQKTKSNGYKEVNLSKDGLQKMWYVHRLVALGFLGLQPSEKNIFVCHKDDDVSNNNLDNLFLGTHSDNMRDMIAKKRNNPYRIRNPFITYLLVKEIRDKGKFGTYEYLGKYWGVHIKTIDSIIKERIWVGKSLDFLKENNYGN